MVFLDPRSVATGDHKVTIGDTIESSICQANDQESAQVFLPVDRVPDEATLKRDYEKLRLAARLNQEMALEVRQDSLLPRILDLLLDLFKADRGVILLRDDHSEELFARAVKVRGKEAGKGGEAINLSKTILKQVTEQRTAVLTSDAQRDNRFSSAHSVILSGIRSTMCVPLLAHQRGDVLGVIHLDSLYRPGAFTERDLGVLQGVAHQAAVAIENARLVERIQQEAVTRQKFEKMMSPNLVDKVISGDLSIEKGGQLKTLTVMFTDIRGFTSLSESKPPQEIIKMLNEYFEVVVDVVFEFDGTMDKYIGDSVMALWGAPVDDPEHAAKAVQAAIQIQKAMVRFNELRQLDGLEAIHTGIGIDTGEIVAGYIGSSKTMAYTVVGDSANQASRLCSVAKGGEILISDTTFQACNGSVAALQKSPLTLKGISRPVANWSVDDIWSRVAEDPTSLGH
jgi:adenylate cyclase